MIFLDRSLRVGVEVACSVLGDPNLTSNKRLKNALWHSPFLNQPQNNPFFCLWKSIIEPDNRNFFTIRTRSFRLLVRLLRTQLKWRVERSSNRLKESLVFSDGRKECGHSALWSLLRSGIGFPVRTWNSHFRSPQSHKGKFEPRT